MATAIVGLANLTLGANAANVTFSSISGSYRDLMLVVTATSAANDEVVIQLNGDTTTNNYQGNYMYGDGTTAGGYANSSFWGYLTTGNFTTVQTTAGFNTQVHFLDYSATDKHKPYLLRTGNAANATEFSAGRWQNTSAITTIKVFNKNGQNFTSGSTFALYGVSA